MSYSNSFLASALATANAQYLTGAHTKLWKNWGSKNIMPSYNKLYYIKKGDLHFCVNGKIFKGGPGCLVLLPAGSMQTYHAYQDDTAEKYWFHFTLLCGETDLFEQLTVGNVVNVPEEDDEMIASLFSKVVESENTNNLSVLLNAKSAIFALVSYFIDNTTVEASLVQSSSSFIELTKFIQENLDRKLTIEEMSDIMHLSPNYFIRLFRSHYGVTPMKYLTEQRLKLACRLLIDKRYSIKDIAIKTGFSTVYYFDRIFKNHTGFTPSRYRMIAINWTEEEEKKTSNKE